MKYAFFDIDGTIYKGFSSNDLIEYLFENGIITSKLYPEYESMVENFMSGNIPYNNAVTMFVKYFGKVLTGLQEHEIESINVRLIKENNKLFPWVRETVDYLRDNGYSIHLLSAAIETITLAISDLIEADSVHGSKLEITNGVYTGKVINVLNHTSKTEIIKELMREAYPINSIGFGDSVGDIEMLHLTNQAFIVHPKQDELFKIIEENKWVVLEDGKEINQIREYLTKVK